MANRTMPFILFLAVIPVLALIIFPVQSRSPDNPAAQFSDSGNPGSLGALGGGTCAVDHLVGFHTAESWGVWSSSDPAEIILKDEIRGRIRIRIVANAVNDGGSHQLNITIGDITRVVELLPNPKAFDLDYALSKPARNITFSGVTPRSLQEIGFSQDPRKLGVGLVIVQCQPADVEKQGRP